MYQLSSTHSFDIELAKSLGGIELPILLHHINFWIKYNERARKNFNEGRFWMYQTIEEMSHHFPYWSEKQIRTYLGKLVSMGILIKGNFNKSKMDQTCWYTIDFQKLFTFSPNGQIDLTKQSNPKDQTGRPIPDTKTNTKTNTPKGDIAPVASLDRYNIKFSFESLNFEGISNQDLEKWKELYPSVDINRELKIMSEWCLANCKTAKSKKKSWRQFINNWFRDNNEKNINKQAYQATKQTNNENKPPKETGFYNSETRKDSPLANYKF